MTQPTLFDQPVPLPPHSVERSQQGTAFVQNEDNRTYLEGNNRKILQYWQRNNIWLSKRNALNWLGVDCLAQRVRNLIENGVAIDKRPSVEFKNHIEYRLLCTCRHVHGQAVGNCYLHSQELKVK